MKRLLLYIWQISLTSFKGTEFNGITATVVVEQTIVETNEQINGISIIMGNKDVTFYKKKAFEQPKGQLRKYSPVSKYCKGRSYWHNRSWTATEYSNGGVYNQSIMYVWTKEGCSNCIFPVQYDTYEQS
jgi:hypothetical protein